MEMTLLLAAVALGAPFVVRSYLRWLPEAPACPACSLVTRVSSADGAAMTVLLSSLPVTTVRECTGCGWRGRMRWKRAPRRVRRDE